MAAGTVTFLLYFWAKGSLQCPIQSVVVADGMPLPPTGLKRTNPASVRTAWISHPACQTPVEMQRVCCVSGTVAVWHASKGTHLPQATRLLAYRFGQKEKRHQVNWLSIRMKCMLSVDSVCPSCSSPRHGLGTARPDPDHGALSLAALPKPHGREGLSEILLTAWKAAISEWLCPNLVSLYLARRPPCASPPLPKSNRLMTTA